MTFVTISMFVKPMLRFLHEQSHPLNWRLYLALAWRSSSKSQATD